MFTYHKRRHWYFKWWGIILILLILLVLSSLAGAGLYIYDKALKINQEKLAQTTLAENQAQQAALVGLNNYWIGSKNPTVTIEEFGDFACPYTKESALAVRQMAVKYANSVKFIWRDYLGHDNSLTLSLAAQCAGEQNNFWLMHDFIFANQDKIQTADLSTFAQKLGLDVNKFNDCLTNQKYLNILKKDAVDADQLEVQGTPTWFINGHRLEGAISADDFDSLITGILKVVGESTSSTSTNQTTTK